MMAGRGKGCWRPRSLRVYWGRHYGCWVSTPAVFSPIAAVCYDYALLAMLVSGCFTILFSFGSSHPD